MCHNLHGGHMTDYLQYISNSPILHAPNPANISYDNTYRSVIIMELFFLAALFVLDVCTTEFILVNGGQEMNAVMVGIVNSSSALHLMVKGAVLAMVIATVYYANRVIKHSGTFALVILIGWYISVIFHNLGVIFL